MKTLAWVLTGWLAAVAVPVGPVCIVCVIGDRCHGAPNMDPLPGYGTYAQWRNGPCKDATLFPIAVWLQEPRNAPKYQALGINLYVALWRGRPPSRSPS